MLLTATALILISLKNKIIFEIKKRVAFNGLPAFCFVYFVTECTKTIVKLWLFCQLNYYTPWGIIKTQRRGTNPINERK